MSTTIPLFQKAGIDVNCIHDILNLGIYITNAVKTPKSEYAVSTESILESLSALEREIQLFPNLKVIMLMGDVAKKCVQHYQQERGREKCSSKYIYLQIA